MLKVRGRRDWSAVAGDVNHGFGQEYHNEERICQRDMQESACRKVCRLWMWIDIVSCLYPLIPPDFPCSLADTRSRSDQPYERLANDLPARLSQVQSRERDSELKLTIELPGYSNMYRVLKCNNCQRERSISLLLIMNRGTGNEEHFCSCNSPSEQHRDQPQTSGILPTEQQPWQALQPTNLEEGLVLIYP